VFTCGPHPARNGTQRKLNAQCPTFICLMISYDAGKQPTSPDKESKTVSRENEATLSQTASNIKQELCTIQLNISLMPNPSLKAKYSSTGREILCHLATPEFSIMFTKVRHGALFSSADPQPIYLRTTLILGHAVA
jgi:hypothetical protein